MSGKLNLNLSPAEVPERAMAVFQRQVDFADSLDGVRSLANAIVDGDEKSAWGLASIAPLLRREVAEITDALEELQRNVDRLLKED